MFENWTSNILGYGEQTACQTLANYLHNIRVRWMCCRVNGPNAIVIGIQIDIIVTRRVQEMIASGGHIRQMYARFKFNSAKSFGMNRWKEW